MNFGDTEPRNPCPRNSEDFRQMGLLEKNMNISMVRADLEDIPQYRLPADFSVRWFQPGDEGLWRHLQSESERYFEITPEVFKNEFGSDFSALADRQLFLYDSQRTAVGTATAWFDDDHEGLPYGRIHWVAIIPSMRGKGLSRPLMTITCNRMKELGHVRAYLNTSTKRIPAIRLYSTFGFVPNIRNEQDELIWDELERKLRKNFRNQGEA